MAGHSGPIVRYTPWSISLEVHREVALLTLTVANISRRNPSLYYRPTESAKRSGFQLEVRPGNKF